MNIVNSVLILKTVLIIFMYNDICQISYNLWVYAYYILPIVLNIS